MKNPHSQLRHYLTLQIPNLQRQLTKARLSASPGSIHKLRVTCRRILALLRLLKKTPEQPSLQVLPKILKSLIKNLGGLRELDVAFRDAKTYGLDNNRLKHRRKQARKITLKKLQKEGKIKMISKLKAIALEIENSPAGSLKVPVRKMNKEIRRWAGHGKKQKQNLHKFRIAVKNLRYSMEALGLAVPELQKLQSTLGGVHDLEILEEFFSRKHGIHRDEKSLRAKALAQSEFALRTSLKKLEQITWPEGSAAAHGRSH